MDKNVLSVANEAIVKAQAEFLSKVYSWMFGALLLSGFTAWYVYSSGLYIGIASSQILFFGLIIAQFGLVIWLSSSVQKLSFPAAAGLFLLYSLLTGATFSVILAAYTAESIQQVFFISAGMFAALSAFGYYTKKDLSAMGTFMYMGLIGLIIAMVVNIFLASSLMYFAISVIGVIVFAGLTAWDTQKLKQMAIDGFEDGETASKGAILGALTLYLDFINLFLFLLRLLGSRR